MFSTRVSNELGAGNPEKARSAVRVVMFIAVAEAGVVSGTLLASHRILGYAYSNEEDIISYVSKMVPLVCISVITDGLQGILSGYFFSSIMTTHIIFTKHGRR
jgi:multidrug resistance protein, MATE family